MTKRLLLTAVLASSAAALGSASAAGLAASLPAGALLTLETHNAGPALDRFLNLAAQLAKPVGGADVTDAVSGAGSLVKAAIGQEATLGVFAVSDNRGAYAPGLLAVSKLNSTSQSFFASLVRQKRGAKVGRYPFVRQDGMYVGLGGGLVYLSSDKALLMGYLGRLSGKAAPRLNASSLYTRPQAAVGTRQLGLYLNFSGIAKVVRSQLGTVLVPRLFSPVVDALDTLGSYSAGFDTTASGLNAAAALVPNAAGADQPLQRLLTHTADLNVQSVIPASVETVRASACAPGRGAYTARWLARFDLLDPTGFLSDSQLEDRLTRADAYLGDECAQVTFAGSAQASLSGQNTYAYTAAYHRVTDRQAAEAEMPGYAAAVNKAIQGVVKSLTRVESGLNTSLNTVLGTEDNPNGLAALGLQTSLRQFRQQIGRLKLVYGFRGDYLVTAYSQAALDRALDESGPVLADAAGFQAAGLNVSGVAGFSYAAPVKAVSPQAFAALLRSSGGAVSGLGYDQLISGAVANLYNRFQGSSSQSTVRAGVILSKSAVRYRW